MSLTPFRFESKDIRVITDERGEPLFVGKDICEALGYTNPAKAMNDHCKGVTKRYPLQTAGGMQDVRVLTEADMFRLVVNSTLPSAEAFERLVFEEILPTIRKTGSYSRQKAGQPRPITRNQVAASILLLRSAAEDLKLAPSAVLGGYQQIETRLGVSGLLPAYATDAPASSVAGSSEDVKALGGLLEEHGVGMSAIAFNRLLVQRGIIEERERPSSKGGTKKFKVVTNLEYGKNATHPNNPRETQPLWYPSKFADLLELVLPGKPTAVASPMDEMREAQQ